MPAYLRPALGRGFTLIEILVVMVIIGVLGSVAVTRVNFGGGRDQQRDHARRLHVMLQLAVDEALLNNATLGLLVTTDSYRFLQRQKADGDDWSWVDYDADGKLQGTRFEDDGELFLDLELEAQQVALNTLAELEADDEPVVPHIWFLPDGELLPQYRLIVNARESERLFYLEPTPLEPVSLSTVAR